MAIKDDFKKRSQKDSSFSLRAYSKYLGISPASLSNILSEKSPISPKMLMTISRKINLNNIEELEKKIKESKKQKSVKFTKDRSDIRKLKQDEFEFISEWYYYAILEIFNLDSFDKSPEWIADRLNLNNSQIVEEAINRLLRLRLLKTENGKLELNNEFTSILEDHSSSIAMRNRQKQVMDLNKAAIDNISLSKRDHSTITLTIDSDMIPEIKNKIKKFRREIGNYICKNKKKSDEIYEIQISFCPLTTKVK